ncbi:unnamed protein product, partial [Didymodactylos carnosus]
MDTAVDNINLTQLIKNTFTSLLTSDVFMQSIETIVNKACQRHDELIKQLTNELKDTKDELRLVQNDLNQLEQYGKRRDLLIYGISYTKDENVT